MALHTPSRLQLALMFCCIVSLGCGPMELPFCAGPSAPAVDATIVLTRLLPCRLQPTPWTASSTQWLSSIPWLTTSICSRCAVHLCMSSTCKRFPLACQPHGSMQQRVWATRTPFLSPNWSYECAAAPSPRMGVPALCLRGSCAPQAAGVRGCQPTIEAASLNASPLQEAKDAVPLYQSLPVQHLLAAVCDPALSCHK